MYERILRSAIYGYGTGRKLRNSWGRHEVAGGTHGNLKESYMEKKEKMFRDRTLLQTIASCGTASARPT